MTYRLDTNACIEHFRSKGTSAVSTKLLSLRTSDVALCSIVKAELWAGIFRAPQREEAKRQLLKFFGIFRSIPFTDDAAQEFGRLHAKLAIRGTPINAADLLIAAIALQHNLTVVTHNVSDFSKVPVLRLEDWQ